jgi:hypothetical protein
MPVLKYAVALVAVVLIGQGNARAAEPIVESQECKARASSLHSPGKAIKHGLPRYPAALKSGKNLPSGYVLLSFQLGDDGRPGDIKVLCEIPNGLGFADSAKQALAETIYPSGKAGEYGRVTRFRMQ